MSSSPYSVFPSNSSIPSTLCGPRVHGSAMHATTRGRDGETRAPLTSTSTIHSRWDIVIALCFLMPLEAGCAAAGLRGKSPMPQNAVPHHQSRSFRSRNVWKRMNQFFFKKKPFSCATAGFLQVDLKMEATRANSAKMQMARLAGLAALVLWCDACA